MSLRFNTFFPKMFWGSHHPQLIKICSSCEQLLHFLCALLCVRIVFINNTLKHILFISHLVWVSFMLSVLQHIIKIFFFLVSKILCSFVVGLTDTFEFRCRNLKSTHFFPSIPDVLETGDDIWSFPYSAHICVSVVSVCLCVWSVYDPCNRLIRILWGRRSTGAGKSDPVASGSNRGENCHDPTTLTFTVSSTWIYADIPPLLSVCFFPSVYFLFFLKEFSRMCSHQILSHVHCIRWWFFRPAKVETKLFSPVLENQKGRMLFRSWKGSCASRGTLHQGQWDLCSLESSEVMIIFKFVSFDAKR